MNISVFNRIMAQRGWRLVRRLNTSYQYTNSITENMLTVSVCDAENVPEALILKTELYTSHQTP